jgi:N-methylhydantoinase A
LLSRLDEVEPAALEEHYRRLETAGRAKIADEAPDALEIVLGRFADMRYGGQEHTVKVEVTGAATSPEIAARFEREYERLFGHRSKGVPIEIVSIRVIAEGRLAALAIDHLGEMARREARAGPGARREVYLAGGFVPTPIHYRTALPPGARLDGPAVIQEYGSTTVLHPGDRLRVEANGVMVIEVGEG